MFDSTILISLVTDRMPFGKYKGYFLCDIPVHYLEWMSSQGFAQNKLGMQLSTLFEIKTNGLEHLLKPIKKEYQKK